MEKLNLKILFALGLMGSALAAPLPLARSRTEIMQLGARLNVLEKDLGHHNDKYLAAVEQVRELEEDLAGYHQRLMQVKEEAKKKDQEMAAILRAHTLSLVEDEVVRDDQYQMLLKENRAKAQAHLQEAQNLEGVVAQFQGRLQTLREDEVELAKLRQDLETKKRQMTEVYLSKLEERQKLESNLTQRKIETKLVQNKKAEEMGLNIPPSMKFIPPLAAFSEALASEKGVTYKFASLQALKAPRDGRVAYNGELASYGQVLMIDHGDEVRTVLLGKFKSTLAKNAQVKMGDVLGYTNESGDSIYFEVRKKNIAQKTIHWMEDTATSKM